MVPGRHISGTECMGRVSRLKSSLHRQRCANVLLVLGNHPQVVTLVRNDVDDGIEYQS